MAVSEDDIKRLAGIDKDALEGYIKDLDTINARLKEQALSQQAIAMNAVKALNAVENLEMVETRINELTNEIATATQNIREADEAGEQFKKLSNESLKAELELRKKNLENAKGILAAQETQINLKRQQFKDLEIEFDAKTKLLAVEERLKKIKLKPGEGEDKDPVKFATDLAKAATGASVVSEGLGENLLALTAKATALSFVVPGLEVSGFTETMKKFAATTDDAFRMVMKSGISFSDGFYGIFQGALDPIISSTEEFNFISKDFRDEMILNTNLTGEDMHKAALAAKNGISIFRRDLIDTTGETRANAAATLNLMANINKLGVAHEDSAKAIDFFTRGLGETPEMARESVRSLTNIAHTLDLNVATVFKEFSGTMGDLAQFGDRQIQVFADLQAQFRSTGVEVDTLSKMAAKLDTFKGAAQAAQGLNAVLGDTVLSVTDLVHADPAEKINLLKQAFDRSGISFATADRRIKQIVASMLGIDVAAATKLFGSEEDFFTVQKQMDTSAEDIDKLRGRVEETLKVTERATKTQQSLAAASTKIMKRAYETANEVSTSFQETFADAVEGSRDVETALVTLIAKMEGMKKIGGAAKSVLDKTVGAAAFASIIGEIFRATGGAISKASLIKMFEKHTKIDIGNHETGELGPDGTVFGLAEGGIVKAQPGGVPAVLAEAGEDEAVIPLNKLAGMFNSPDGPVQLVLQDVTLHVEGLGEGKINQIVEGTLNAMVTGKPEPALL